LHIFKATADVGGARRLYEEITDVEPFYENMVRPAVLARKMPRKVFVQANTVEEGGKVVLREYEATNVGMVQSYVDREYV
jgi:dipeptidyl-peptidase-3